MTSDKPIVLCFGGNDPTGGAGLAADILSLNSLGCHCAPVVTAITSQDTSGLKQFSAVDAPQLISQARAILEDMDVAAFKTGMLPTTEAVSAIAAIADEYANIPLVLDPVLTTGAGQELSEEPIEDALRSLLIPRANLITPNSLEACRLAREADTLGACAQSLLSLGAEYVLITGTHEKTKTVVNHLHGHGLNKAYEVARLPGSYHGSGCTLAAACAAGLAHKMDIVDVVTHAIKYTEGSLKAGFKPGRGQAIPERLYWANAKGKPRIT